VETKSSVKPYLQLMRPANIITAIADILAGISVSFYSPFATMIGAALHDFWRSFRMTFELIDAFSLMIATIGLYGGGVVLNDYFDADLDKVERPERPIPSGAVSKENALFLGVGLLGLGVIFALKASVLSGIIALMVALLAVFYDYRGKHIAWFAPLNMGLCRGGNLLLGASILPNNVYNYWWLALIPIVYISAITLISRGEVHGGSKTNLKKGLMMYLLVILSLLGLLYFSRHQFTVIPFLFVFAYFIFPPLIKAINEPKPEHIRIAVKSGVISLILMDATLTVIFSNIWFALIVLALLPISRGLAKKFAVT
jgi:4-hydroxybenzoate polyprenyltransferase